MSADITFVLGVFLAVVAILSSIALHEAGHLLAARRFGVAAPEFAVGFGPQLLSFTPKNGPTSYRLRLLPLGGYVRMAGMYPPPGAHAKTGGLAATSYATQQEQESSWVGKRIWQLRTWQKVIIMAAGPAVNIVLAVGGLVAALSLVGAPSPSTSLHAVVEDSPAAAAGLEPGDRITAVNGTAIEGWAGIVDSVGEAAGTVMEVEYARDGVTTTVPVDATESETIGVAPAIRYERMPLAQVPGEIATMVSASIEGIIAYPANLVELAGTTFSEAPRAEDSPVSMVGAGDLSGQITSQETLPVRGKAFLLLSLFAALNLFLGLFNCLPLTPLDGGHIATALASSARRKVAALRRREDPGAISPAVLTPLTLTVTAIFIVSGMVTVVADIVEPLRMFH